MMFQAKRVIGILLLAFVAACALIMVLYPTPMSPPIVEAQNGLAINPYNCPHLTTALISSTTPTLVPNMLYVPDEILLTGVTVDVQQIAVTAGLTLIATPIDFVDLTPYSFQAALSAPIRYPDAIVPSLSIGLYAIPPGSTISQTLQTVYGIVEAELAQGNIAYPVYVDPNYVTGRPVNEVSGEPWCVGAGSIPTNSASAGATMFQTQWALQQGAGINVNDEKTRKVSETGAETTVAVFDTSPFMNPNGKQFD
ncbi:MAG: hypothetical protein AAF629_32520, partial [Chloroflexota bacterium]